MNALVDVLVIVLLAGLVALGGYIGYTWRDGEVADLKLNAADERLRADYQTDALAELQGKLDAQADRYIEQQAAAQQELAARGDRIAQLLADASARQATTAQMAAADEDCAPLRDLPVCAAVADRLFGGPVAARPH